MVIRKFAFALALLATPAGAQTPDKTYAVTLTWAEWLKIGTVLDKQSIGEFYGIYDKMQKQFVEQNQRENAAAAEGFEKRVREKIEAEKPKEEPKP